MSRRSIKTLFFFITVAITLAIAGVSAQTRKKTGASISPEDLRGFLSYLASDELEGRATFTEGLGLAAAYIAEQMRSWGVKPGGDNGSYFQRVAVKGVKSTNRSTLTVEVNGQTRTFKDGEGITFPRNVGANRVVTLDQVEFLGYGLYAPSAKHDDYAGKDVKGKAIVFLGPAGPKDLSPQLRRTLGSRATTAIEERYAAATIGVLGGFGRGGAPAAPAATPAATPPATPAATPPAGQPPAGPPAGRGFGPVPLEPADFTTVQRLDRLITPSVTGQDAFFEFLFSAADVKYADLKEKATKQEPLPGFTLKGVKLTFNLDADYRVVRTQFTRNVVGIVEGSDAKLKDTFVTFGAHYDHVGYAEGEVADGGSAPTRRGAPGRVKAGAVEDRIWNGADDDGSGTAALMAVAKAFATGPKPKRSVAFFFHSGEERGLYGSRYNADYPAVPIEKTAANLNMDMIGRNNADKSEESSTVYLVGSDRISSELHQVLVDVNAGLAYPLTLKFDWNDPADPERIYYRSDHYSYAAKGIPIIFFTTGLHADYHFNTDSVEKIQFEKMARIGQLVYELGKRVADLDHVPVRDNKGPRAGASPAAPK